MPFEIHLKNNWKGSWKTTHRYICYILFLCPTRALLFSLYSCLRADTQELHHLYFLPCDFFQVSANSRKQHQTGGWQEIVRGIIILPVPSLPGQGLTIAMFFCLRPQLLLTNSLPQDDTFLESLKREGARSVDESCHHPLTSYTGIQNTYNSSTLHPALGLKRRHFLSHSSFMKTNLENLRILK